MNVLAKFEYLLLLKCPYVQTIVWDLDGTLGDMPGWNGTMPLTKYIHQLDSLRILLAHLTNAYGIRHLLVSRNAMFCGDRYIESREFFKTIGFHGVLNCYRRRSHSKVEELSNPERCLLIDDQWPECIWAVTSGSTALHVKRPFFDALTLDDYVIVRP